MGFNYFDAEGLGARILVHSGDGGGAGDFLFESAPSDSSKMDDFGEKQLRASAMSIALAWVEDANFSFPAIDALVIGMSDLDEDGEVSEEEEDFYNELLWSLGDALVALGGNKGQVETFIDKEDDDAGAKLGAFLKKKLDETEDDDADIIGRFVIKGDMVFEATKKVIRNGKVVLIRKPVRKKRLSAAQRMGLKKARRKSNTGAARLARKKSMRLRKQRGI